MIDLTTVVSYMQTEDGLYYHGELFVHIDKNTDKKMFIVISDGFDNSINIEHIGFGFFQFIEAMFGQEEEYIFIFNENSYMYIYEVIDSKNYTRIHSKIAEEGQEMWNFIDTHKEYFNE